jgi:hypothetical protein
MLVKRLRSCRLLLYIFECEPAAAANLKELVWSSAESVRNVSLQDIRSLIYNGWNGNVRVRDPKRTCNISESRYTFHGFVVCSWG